MVELAVQRLLVTDLAAGQPFGAKAVDAVDPVAGAQVESAVAAQVIGQVQAQAQVVRAAASAPGVDHQGIVVALVHHAVLHPVEVVQAIQRTHVGLQAAQFQRRVDWLADVRADYIIADLGIVFDPDCGDYRRALARRAGHGQAGVALELAQGGQAWVKQASGAVTGVDHVAGTAEVSHAEGGQRWLDEDVVAVQTGQLFFGVASGHQSDRLIQHVDHRQ
ncbi:hypothetical protein D3C79_586530 [compost metagenome]